MLRQEDSEHDMTEHVSATDDAGLTLLAAAAAAASVVVKQQQRPTAVEQHTAHAATRWRRPTSADDRAR